MDTENQVPKGGDDQPVAGKVKEVVGWATGDREVEAEGRAEGESDGGVDEVTDEIRKEHGDKGIAASD